MVRVRKNRFPPELWLAVFGGGATLLFLLVVYLLFGQPNPQTKEHLGQEGEKIAEVGLKDLDDATIRKELSDLFESLGEACRKADGDKIAVHFDGVRMVREFFIQAKLPLPTPQEEEQLQAKFQRFGPANFARAAPAMAWTSAQLRRVKILDAPGEVVVTVRHRVDQDLSWCTRWWLRKTAGRWLIYDSENLQTGIRGSSLGSFIQFEGKPELPAWTRAMHSLPAIQAALMQGKLDQAELLLSQIAPVQFPPPLEALRWAWVGSIKLHQGRIKEALEDFEKAESFKGDLPLLDFLRAVAHNQSRNSEKAIHHAQKYLDAVGDNAEAYDELGIALSQLKRFDEAANAYRMALDDDPQRLQTLVGLQQVLAAGKKGELGERFAKLARPGEAIEELVKDALGGHDTEAMEVVTTAFGKAAPDDPRLGYYTVRMKILKGQTQEAAALFPKAITSIKDEKQKKEYRSGFLGAMVDAGKPLEAYQATPDAATFAFLAADLFGLSRFEDLRRLVAVHQKLHKDDVWLLFYTGELHIEEKAFDKAEKAFAAGMAKPLDEAGRERFRESRVFARFQSGKGLSAYTDIGPKKKTFDQLATLFSNTRQAKELAALMEAHRQTDPKDQDLPGWELEARWLEGDYAKVVTLITDHRPALLASAVHRWKVSDRLIRSLVRLKRFDEALKEADVARDGKPAPFFRAVVHAAAGDVAKTEQVLQECVDRHEWIGRFYTDPDLGPILRSETFRKLRSKYPEPENLPGKPGAP
jgi:tetratricopeptide (TPR) repeat protein